MKAIPKRIFGLGEKTIQFVQAVDRKGIRVSGDLADLIGRQVQEALAPLWPLGRWNNRNHEKVSHIFDKFCAVRSQIMSLFQESCDHA